MTDSGARAQLGPAPLGPAPLGPVQGWPAALRTLVAHLPGGAVFVVDHELRYLVAAGDALGAAGLGPDDFVGRTVAETLPADAAASRAAHYRQALGGVPFQDEHEVAGRVFASRGVPLRDAAGRVYAAPNASPNALRELTAREGEVLRLVARGHSNKEVGAALAISVKTVETHKANAVAKLGLAGRAALVRFALDEGWLAGG